MKFFLLFCFCAAFLTSSAQDKNQFFALDANMNQTVLDSSKYILWIHEKEDSNWQWDYYYTWGPLIKSRCFADHDGTLLNGRSSFYTKLGNLDSTGIYSNGKKNGSFYKFKSNTNDSIEIIQQHDYINDSLVKSIIVKPEKSMDADSSHSKESEFPGGMPAWYDYVGHHLVYPDRAVSKEIQGTVLVFFLVDKEGDVRDVYLEKSVEYSIDQESVRVIKGSGKWVPGIKDGLPVKTYKVMPLNFKLESQ